MKKSIILSLMLLLCAVMTAQTEKTPAFPGAEGFGRYTTGGRGGVVCHVRSLEDSDVEGTFRWACKQKGPRIIVFDVDGTIQLKSELKLSNGDVTIAGQTAPGGGICVAGYPFVIAADNVIVRFMRFRLGNENVAGHEGDGLGGMDLKNVIIDHCSVSWSIDECLSVYGSSNITVQWCIASHSLVNSGHAKGAHGYGGNWGGSGASYHHNLLAHHQSRVPRLGPRQGTQEDERMDLRNNVFYNWAGEGCYGGEGMKVNIVNNYYKPGAATEMRNQSIQRRITAPGVRTVDYCIDKETTAANYNQVFGTSLKKDDVKGLRNGSGRNCVSFGGAEYEIDMDKNTVSVSGKTVVVAWNGWKPMLHAWGKFYVEGNYNPKYPDDGFTEGVTNQVADGKNDNTFPGEDGIRIHTPVDFVRVTTHSAAMAYEKVLAYAGASLCRDNYDEVIVSDTRNGSATWTAAGNAAGQINGQDDIVYADGKTGWPVLAKGMPKADTDGDGMPDEWERANGLNPDDAADGKVAGSDGYTNLERYLNSIVNSIVEGENAGGTAEGYIETGEGEPDYADCYDISGDTYIGNTGDTEWTFDNGFGISNASGYAGYKGFIKYKSGNEYIITIPGNLSIEKIRFIGYTNKDSGTKSYIEKLGTGTFGAGEYELPFRDGIANTAEYVIALDNPASKTLTVKFGGSETCMKMILYPVVNEYVEGGEAFEISQATSETENKAGSPWYFKNGITVTNVNGKTYGTGEDDCVKYSRNVLFTIGLPEGMSVGKVKVSGYDNNKTGDNDNKSDAYIEQLGPDSYAPVEYLFPAKTVSGKTMKEYEIALDVPAHGTLPFKIGGNELAMKMTIYSMPEVKLHEQSATFGDIPACRANVRLIRTLSTEYLNTFCVPFDITEEQIKETWGSDTEVMGFDAVNGTTLIFKCVSEIKAGIPYIVKPAMRVEEPVFYGVTIVPGSPKTVMIGGYGFAGNYTKHAMAYGGSELMLGTNGKLARPKQAPDNVLRGMRGYFIVPVASAANAKVAFGEDGTTGIETSVCDKGNADMGIYSLGGQLVGKSLQGLPKGVYISGGRKIVVK